MKLIDAALIRLIERGELTLEFKDVTSEQFTRALQLGAYQALYDIFLVMQAADCSDGERLAKIDAILRDVM
jgi:hypothetical protein